MKKRYEIVTINIKSKTMKEPTEVKFGREEIFFDKKDVVTIRYQEGKLTNLKEEDIIVDDYFKKNNLRVYNITFTNGIYISNILLTEDDIKYLTE